MKFLVTAMALSLLGLTACTKNSPVAPTGPSVPVSSAPSPAQLPQMLSGLERETMRVEATALAAKPVITGIGGATNPDAGITNGLVDMGKCGGTFDGGRVVNDQAGTYRWTIRGRSFGAARGAVLLAGRSVTVRQWTDAQIDTDPITERYDQGPASTMLSVRTAAGSEVTQTVSLVPAIRSRIYGQCTYFVALTRLRLGLQASPGAYAGYSNITANYGPAAGDQYQWSYSGGKHTAIATAVSGPRIESNGTRTWTVTIDEMNADCRNGQNRFTATFAVRNGAVITLLRHYKLGTTSLFYR